MSNTDDPIAAAINGAAPPPPRPQAAQAAGGHDGADAPEDKRGAGWWDQCPITPLGISGTKCYFLDGMQQLIEVPAEKLSRLLIMHMCASHPGFLREAWPKCDEKGNVKGWAPELAQEELFAACAARGVWNPQTRVRGRGGWLGPNGELVMHLGNRIWFGDRWERPGWIEGHVYPAGAPIPPPARQFVAGGQGGAGNGLLSLLKCWTWRRPSVDPVLLLGWMASAMLGGALRWRPMIWITGDRGSGKSTLMDEVLRAVLGGEDAVCAAPDATPAAIYQTLKYDSRPVLLDEMEASDDNRRGDAMVKLVRIASSGGWLRRGGDGGQAAEYQIRSGFALSSINVLSMTPQDRSRLAILELEKSTGTKPKLVPAELMAAGQAMRRRLLDQWHRWEDTLSAYRAALTEYGHDQRSADQFGALLAAADLVLHDTPPSSEELDEWGRRLRASSLAEKDDEVADHEACLHHVLSFLPDVHRNDIKRPIGAWIPYAAWPQGVADKELDAIHVLAALGMRVVCYGTRDQKDMPQYLAVCNSGAGIDRLFAGTHWRGRPGGAGAHIQALRRIPGALHTRPADNDPGKREGIVIKVGGVNKRVTLVPLAAIWPPDGRPSSVDSRAIYVEDAGGSDEP